MSDASRRVLVVDDHEESADLIRLLLEERGCTTAVAHAGPAALEAVRTFAPDVVLLDLSLPGMSGDQVARALRAEHGPRTPRLVALSGYDDASLRDRCDASVFDGVGTKPDRLEDLERFLDEHVGA
jgi:CheY-like chemotaxis protein